MDLSLYTTPTLIYHKSDDSLKISADQDSKSAYCSNPNIPVGASADYIKGESPSKLIQSTKTGGCRKQFLLMHLDCEYSAQEGIALISKI